MQKTEVKTIAFKGMERINERINCNNGACEEIINLRPHGNTWHNVGKRKNISPNGLTVTGDGENIQPYKIILHPESKDKYIILWINNTLSLYSKDTGNKIKDFDISGNIISVSFLDNVLIVCTEDKKYFFLYDSQKQDYKPVSFDNVSATVTAKSLPMCKKQYMQQDNGGRNSVFYDKDFGKGNRLFPIRQYQGGNLQPNINYDNISQAVKSCLTYLQEELQGQQNTVFYDSADEIRQAQERNIVVHTSDAFRGLSFYRVAFKLYDGSYVNYSDISFADTNGDDYSNIGSGINQFPVTFVIKTADRVRYSSWQQFDEELYTDHLCVYNPYGSHTVKIRLNNLSDVKNLMEENIIQSIDLFMTRPVFSVDLDSELNITDQQFDKDQSGIGINDEYVYYAGGYIYGYFERNREEIENQLLYGTYYKVKSFDKTDIKKLTDNVLYFATKYDDIKTLEANETLPTPTTDNEVIFHNSYNYNQKQHLFNLFYNIFTGYDLPDDDTELNTGAFLNLVNTVNHNGVIDGLYYTVKGEYNGGSFAIKHKIQNPDNVILFDTSTQSYSLSLPKLFSYPLNDKITFGLSLFYQNGDCVQLYENAFENVFGSQNTDFICNLKSKNLSYFSKTRGRITVSYDFDSFNQTHSFTAPSDVASNRDSHFLPLSSVIDVSQLTVSSFNETTRISGSNILQLSETDNPFVLPNAENYSFSDKDTEILAISNNSSLTTDRNFGTYPLYVFTTDGIYTMAVGGGNTAYSNIIQLNSTRIINKNVLNTPLGVMFLSQRGLCFINGRQTQCVSDLVKGKPTITSPANLNKLTGIAPESFDPVTLGVEKDLNSILITKALTPATDDFLEEIKDAQFYYDELHNEVCIVVKNKYTYVFNLSLLVFYKRSDYFQTENGNTLSFSVNNETMIPKQKIYLYSFEEEFSEDEDICKSIAVITKPFLLDTRHLKHIERIIFDMSWRDKDDFYLVLFGSKDGVNYNIVKKCIKKTNDKGKEHQDVYLELVLSAVKYCFCVICSRNFYDTRIANITFQFKQTANFGGIK